MTHLLPTYFFVVVFLKSSFSTNRWTTAFKTAYSAT